LKSGDRALTLAEITKKIGESEKKAFESLRR
jgi:hypothetical protein